MDMELLKARWINLHKRLCAYDEDTEYQFLCLVGEYNGLPVRHYHDMNHIYRCLNVFDQCKHLISKSDLTELAIWYHDYYCMSEITDNELSSSEQMGLNLHEKMSIHWINIVKGLIMSTKHTEPSDTPAGRYMQDVDLAILGAGDYDFKKYDSNIRKEWLHIDISVYARNRIDVLKSFINRPHIYNTLFFQHMYERRAVENIGWAIKRLQYEMENQGR